MDPSELIQFLETGEAMLLSPSTASKKRARHKNKYDQSTNDEPERNFTEQNQEGLDQWYAESEAIQNDFQKLWKLFRTHVYGCDPDE